MYKKIFFFVANAYSIPLRAIFCKALFQLDNIIITLRILKVQNYIPSASLATQYKFTDEANIPMPVLFVLISSDTSNKSESREINRHRFIRISIS